jgi:hypothetical protein
MKAENESENHLGAQFGRNPQPRCSRGRIGAENFPKQEKIPSLAPDLGAIMSALEVLWPNSVIRWAYFMWIDKLADGVVQVQTPIGPRYLMPSFLQRVYFVWMFRHFPILPHAVLSSWQKRLIDRLCSEQRFVSMAYADGMEDAPVIGTVERRPAMGPELSRSRRAVAGEESRGMAGELRQRS